MSVPMCAERLLYMPEVAPQRIAVSGEQQARGRFRVWLSAPPRLRAGNFIPKLARALFLPGVFVASGTAVVRGETLARACSVCSDAARSSLFLLCCVRPMYIDTWMANASAMPDE